MLFIIIMTILMLFIAVARVLVNEDSWVWLAVRVSAVMSLGSRSMLHIFSHLTPDNEASDWDTGLWVAEIERLCNSLICT